MEQLGRSSSDETQVGATSQNYKIYSSLSFTRSLRVSATSERTVEPRGRKLNVHRV